MNDIIINILVISGFIFIIILFGFPFNYTSDFINYIIENQEKKYYKKIKEV
jgi:hypothetical protein